MINFSGEHKVIQRDKSSLARTFTTFIENSQNYFYSIQTTKLIEGQLTFTALLTAELFTEDVCVAMQSGSPQLLLFVDNIRSGSGYTAATDAFLAVNVVCKLQRMY